MSNLDRDLKSLFERRGGVNPVREGGWRGAVEKLAGRLIERRGRTIEAVVGRRELDLHDIADVSTEFGLGLLEGDHDRLLKQAEAVMERALWTWTARREQARREAEQKLSLAERAALQASRTGSPQDLTLASQLLEQARPPQAAPPQAQATGEALILRARQAEAKRQETDRALNAVEEAVKSAVTPADVENAQKLLTEAKQQYQSAGDVPPSANPPA